MQRVTLGRGHRLLWRLLPEALRWIVRCDVALSPKNYWNVGYLNDHRKLEIQLVWSHQQDARRITHTPCSRRACEQCGQVNPKAYFKFNLSKAFCGAWSQR
ncbi:hypothetical protein [Desulfosporosinus sp. BICA1-9]|uniref:hypothetical protein n=1 Tax=Desulfosporosinus sp. BICA1-9 TaxID=1531958 RepID=UPI0025C044E5|nr:hypothetical protein [Desulfosporosinus sp. BICA1-9]